MKSSDVKTIKYCMKLLEIAENMTQVQISTIKII